MEEHKVEHLLNGIEKEEQKRDLHNPINDYFMQRSRINYGMACELAIIISNLTSSNKDDRERGKRKVRELVKLGKEETK